MTSRRVGAVVVGGGIVGANCAVQLTRAGVENVVILERDAPASKASGRAAGNLTIYRHERFGADASRLGRELYEEYEQKYDDLTLHRTKSYSIAYSDEGADYLRSEHESTTIETELLNADELAEREPEFATDDVTVALGFEDAVYTDPKQLTLAAHAVARDEGATLVQEEARDFEVEGNEISVQTTDGRYESPIVVVAAGAWTKRLLQRAGTDVALRPRTSQIAILEPPSDRDIPMWSAPDLSVYGRSTPEGRVLFGGGTTTPVTDLESFRTRARVPFLLQVGELAPRILPVLEDATLHDDWAGRVSATPDRYPYIGETDIEGLYVCSGFNGEGVSNSPFAARLLTDLIVGTDPLVDPSEFDPTRFEGDEAFEITDAVQWWADR
ncbi:MULTISPECIES: FAD-binding oxidoreductase [Haloferax]|uniref:FAD-dependent oxidoreductase n=1 Tax=Haloferax marinum TaxID=2666143 RepID=A0A6A8GBX5_9EURY|nr:MULTISPECIES: FAD-binding oxidoreductase [Haloferax]KAB1190721.1 FAD-binding oxidoreductase [Haloferax sp. CBA1150]MRW98255.1 FAD-dependent oxidoreductase [Haloferax marinum]